MVADTPSIAFSGYDCENELQRIFAEHPELIPGARRKCRNVLGKLLKLNGPVVAAALANSDLLHLELHFLGAL